MRKPIPSRMKTDAREWSCGKLEGAMRETLKPGTRCECREGREPFHACGLALGQGDSQCRREAVRTVAVPYRS